MTTTPDDAPVWAPDVDTVRRLLRDADGSYIEFLNEGDVKCGVYRLKAGERDQQRPHAEDEVYYVLAGRAKLEIALAKGCRLNEHGRLCFPRALIEDVIAGACPIANPDGPSPWRFAGPAEELSLFGFYVEGAAGVFTHHDRSSHLHAVADGRTGHLDEVDLTDAKLFVPAR